MNSPTLSEAFSETKPDIFAAIEASATLPDISIACYRYHVSDERKEDRTESICQAILDWHIEKISDESISPNAVIKNLNRCMEYVGCSPLDETCSGPHSDEQQKLADILFNRTVRYVMAAQGGDLVNMHLKDYIRAMSSLNLRAPDENRAALAEIVKRNDSDWKISNLRALGLTPSLAFA